MEVIYVRKDNRESFLSEATPCVIAIGFFDGMHKGHQRVLQEAKKVAEEQQLPLVCISFFPHPKEIIAKGNDVQYLMPMADKKQALEEIGVETFYIVQFDPEFAILSPREFVKRYLLELGAVYVTAGFDFTYGFRGEGNMDRLEKDADGLLKAIKVEKVECNGDKISSTLIRQLICSGEMEVLPYYLGNHYQVKGRLNARLQTAEIDIEPYYLLPACGIYEVSLSNGEERWQDRAIVEKGKVRIHFPNEVREKLSHNEVIQIDWLKRVTFAQLEQSV